MSLTQILSYPDVAAEFDKYVHVPAAQPQDAPRMVAPPRYHDSYALVGTAFDYCLRFCVAACNQGLVAEQPWVAEIALKLMEQEEELPSELSLEQARPRTLPGVSPDEGLYTTTGARCPLHRGARQGLPHRPRDSRRQLPESAASIRGRGLHAAGASGAAGDDHG